MNNQIKITIDGAAREVSGEELCTILRARLREQTNYFKRLGNGKSLGNARAYHDFRVRWKHNGEFKRLLGQFDAWMNQRLDTAINPSE